MNDMLDRLEQSRDSHLQFISDASHELRSPITATRATLDVAQSQPESADWKEVSRVLDEENTRLAHLVDDLLPLARLDERPDVRQGAPVDLDELALAEAARPHPVEVGVNVLTPARVEGNASMLTKAIRNLVENASKHAPSQVDVEVGITEATGSPVRAYVRVDDDGPGIAPEQCDLIFGRFNRVDEARARSHGGVGLGLAIVRKVAEANSGSAVAVSKATGGASFVLTIPTTVPEVEPGRRSGATTAS